MNDLTQLISKYMGFIRDPEGSAPEIMDMFFVRDNLEQILENHDSVKNMSPEPHRQIIELDDELWHKIDIFLEIIGSHALQNARTKLNDIQALEEELLEFEPKYGIRSETFYAAYISGEEPEDESWVLDFGEWASVYKTWLTQQADYRNKVQRIQKSHQAYQD